MVRLRESDFRTGLELLGAMQEASRDIASFAGAGVERLPRLVASEFTTLSICHLASGRREVYGLPAGTLSADERAAFDRHFHEHPLVRFHGYQGGGVAQRISDSLPFAEFRKERPLQRVLPPRAHRPRDRVADLRARRAAGQLRAQPHAS